MSSWKINDGIEHKCEDIAEAVNQHNIHKFGFKYSIMDPLKFSVSFMSIFFENTYACNIPL